MEVVKVAIAQLCLAARGKYAALGAGAGAGWKTGGGPGYLKVR